MNRKLLATALGLSLVASAACGGGGGGGGGAHGTKPTTVTLDVPAPANPGESYTIVLDDSSGGLVSSAPAVAGTQQVTVHGNGSVVVAAVLDSQYYYSGAVAPPDGTTLHFVEPFATATPAPAPTSIATWNVTLTNPPGNAASFVVYGPCGSASAGTVAGTFTVDTSQCTGATSAQLFAVAYDGGGTVVAWHLGAVENVAPGTTTPETLALDQTAVVQVVDMFQGLPDEATFLVDEVSLSGPWQFGPVFSQTQSRVPGTTSQPLYPVVPAVESSALLLETVNWGDGFIEHQRPLASVPGAVTFDVGALHMPSAPVFDAPTRTFHWDVQPGFGNGLTFSGYMTAYGATFQVNWFMAMPPGPQSWRLPQLPASVVPSVPFDQMNANAYAMEIEYASQPSYGQFLDILPVPSFGATAQEESVSIVGAQLP